VVLAFRHALRAHEVLSRPYALSGFFEVIHRLFEDGGFVGHDQSIWTGSIRSLDCFSFSDEHADWELRRKRGRLQGF
jgi:hypothetical protein